MFYLHNWMGQTCLQAGKDLTFQLHETILATSFFHLTEYSFLKHSVCFVWGSIHRFPVEGLYAHMYLRTSFLGHSYSLHLFLWEHSTTQQHFYAPSIWLIQTPMQRPEAVVSNCREPEYCQLIVSATHPWGYKEFEGLWTPAMDPVCWGTS